MNEIALETKELNMEEAVKIEKIEELDGILEGKKNFGFNVNEISNAFIISFNYEEYDEKEEYNRYKSFQYAALDKTEMIKAVNVALGNMEL